MKAKLLAWSAAFDGMSLRERLLILVTMVVAVSLPVFMYGVEPAQKERTGLQTKVAKLKAENANKQLDYITLKSQQRVDPNDRLKEQIATLQQRIETLNVDLQARSAHLLSPQEMLSVLQQTLAEQRGLQLLSAIKQPAQLFKSPAAEGEAAQVAVAGVYRHDLTLTVAGGYFDVLEYLKKLEQLPRGFFWDGIDYRVETYPRAQVTLRLHTLSTEQGWLGV